MKLYVVVVVSEELLITQPAPSDEKPLQKSKAMNLTHCRSCSTKLINSSLEVLDEMHMSASCLSLNSLVHPQADARTDTRKLACAVHD